MKQNIILWTGTVVILFLAGYLNNVISKDYPVTGTIGIKGQKVSYYFTKTFYTNEQFGISVRSDVSPVTGTFLWRKKGDTNWNKIKMGQRGEIISVNVPKLDANSIVEYQVEILHNNKVYMLPENHPVTANYIGKVPSAISFLYYITMFVGLLLSIRSGLEYFKEGGHIRRYSLFTLIAFFLHSTVVPVKKTFDLDFLHTKVVPTITQLFDIQAVLLFMLAIAGMAFAFKSSKPKQNVLVISCLILIVFVVL